MSQNDLRMLFKQAIEAVLWKAHVAKNDAAVVLAGELQTLVSMKPYDALSVLANITSTENEVVIVGGAATLTLTWKPEGEWWATSTNDAAGPVSRELFGVLL